MSLTHNLLFEENNVCLSGMNNLSRVLSYFPEREIDENI